jgi:hypothetical protein
MIEAFWGTPAGHGILVAVGAGLTAAAMCLLWGAAEAAWNRWRKK